MKNVIRVNQSIGLDVYMNCVLVKAGLRNAMLIQPADYNEVVSTDPITADKLKALKEEFPELIQSDIDGETIISKRSYKSSDFTSPADMGNVLGFPCAADYTYTLEHTDEPRTAINIMVLLKPGGNNSSSQLITYVCRDDKTFKSALEVAKKAEAILKADRIVGKIVDGVTATKRTIAPPKFLISRLLTNKLLSEDEEFEIVNYVWNLGLENASSYNYDLKNPVHRGILVGLLSVYDNNPVEPFYPLQYRPEGKKVDEITEKWDSALQGIFKQKGGRRSSTRKSKRI
jgi:hypothetical protein